MKQKFTLTTEKIRGKFPSTFDLVNYAIKLAENMVKSGRASRVQTEVENPAVQVIEEIAQGKDRFEEIESEEDDQPDEMEPINGKTAKESNEKTFADIPSAKKGRVSASSA